MPARVNTHQNLEKRRESMDWDELETGAIMSTETLYIRLQIHHSPLPVWDYRHSNMMRFWLLIVMDCQYILFSSLQLHWNSRPTIIFVKSVLEKKKNNNHNNYIHSGISKENVTECVERQKLVVLVNQVNLKITL